MANFSPRPDTRNMRNLFFSFLRSVADGGRSTPVHSVQKGAPTIQLPPANDLENDALSFVEHFGLDEECFRQLLAQPPDIARSVMAGFQPRQDTQNPQGLFISYLRSVAAASKGSKGGAKGGAKGSAKGSALSPIGAFGSWPRSTQPIAVRAAPYDRPPAPQAQGKGPRGVPRAFVTSVSEEELLDFALAWQLDQGCLDFLQTQDAETQRFVVNNFQPKEGTANVSGLFMSYVNSLVRAGKGGKGMHEFYRDAANVARAAVLAAPLFLEHWIRLAIVLSHPALEMPREAGMLVRQAMLLNDTHYCLRGLERMLLPSIREAGTWRPPETNLLERALGGANATRRATSTSREAVLWGRMMRRAQRRCGSPEAAASKEGFKSWMLYEALLRRRGFWGADLYAADFEHKAPSARELLSEDWLREQEAATYEGGRDLVAGHMQTLAFSYSSVYRTMVVSGTAMAAKRVLPTSVTRLDSTTAENVARRASEHTFNRPWERLEECSRCSQRPQHAAERLPLGKAAPVKVFLMVTNAERNRAEIASLRHEISSLLQTNGQLHQHLGQLNSFLPDSSVAANSQGGASAEANLRRSWDNSEAPRPCGHMRSDPGASCLSSPRGAAALASLLRERDDLQQRLQVTELARCAAQQRRATAEAALRRCTEDLEWQRKRIAAQEAGEDQPFGEAELLRKQLREAQDKIAELDVILSARSERVRANERDYAEARVEFDALSVANDAIQKELEATRSRIASEQQGCQAAESELSEFQARMRAEEVEFAAEVETLGSRRSSLETSLRESSANLADMEAEVSAARAQSLGLRAQLEVLQAARDEIVSQEHQATVQQRAEVERLEAKAESLAAEALDLSHRHEQAKVSFQ
ncbi:AOX1A, partial [Symbiodinium necroappetens]